MIDVNYKIEADTLLVNYVRTEPQRSGIFSAWLKQFNVKKIILKDLSSLSMINFCKKNEFTIKTNYWSDDPSSEDWDVYKSMDAIKECGESKENGVGI